MANNILDDEGIENVEYTLGIIQKKVNLYTKYYQALHEENEEEFEHSLLALGNDGNDETKNIDNAIKPKDEWLTILPFEQLLDWPKSCSDGNIKKVLQRDSVFCTSVIETFVGW